MGRKKLARELETDESRIRRALAMLAKMKIVDLEVTHNWTRITLVNWEKYQIDASKLTQDLPKSDPPLTTVKEGIELKKEEKEKNKPLSADAEAKAAIASAYKVQAKELQDYFFAEYERIFKNKLTWTIGRGLQEKAIAVLKAHGVAESKRLADNYLASTFIASPTWRGFLSNPDAYRVPMLKYAKGPKSDFESKRGQGPKLQGFEGFIKPIHEHEFTRALGGNIFGCVGCSERRRADELEGER